LDDMGINDGSMVSPIIGCWFFVKKQNEEEYSEGGDSFSVQDKEPKTKIFPTQIRLQ